MTTGSAEAPHLAGLRLGLRGSEGLRLTVGAAYRKAIAIKGDNWKVLMNFATTLIQTEVKAKHQEAKTLLLKAKTLVPAGEYRVHYNLALAHVRLGENQEALALAREVQSKAAPNDPIVAEAKKLESNLLEKN